MRALGVTLDAASSGASLIRPRFAVLPSPASGRRKDRASLQGRLARDLILYGLCSAAALAVDWGTLTLLVMRGVPALQAAAIGFMLGMAVTYVASITLVYADRRHGSKLHEAAVFMAIGLAGLGLNEVLLYAFAAGLGLAAPLAKAPTAVMVFLFNFAVRRAMLFAAPAQEA